MSTLSSLRGALHRIRSDAVQLLRPQVSIAPAPSAPDEIMPETDMEIADAQRHPMPEVDTESLSDGHSYQTQVPVLPDVTGLPSGPEISYEISYRPGEDSTDPFTAAALTPEQQQVATAPASARQLVIAGPGTGKTFTVTRRLEYLLGPGQVEAGQILVLSFSRSAVREIITRVRRRVRYEGAHGDLDYLQVRTFDSFAYHLLTEVGKAPSLTRNSYDEIISRAARAIAEPDSEARTLIAGLGHVIVDELQDLVGCRAALVKSILLAMEGGFTLLGDPAQAIYDYQSRISSGPSATAFLDWLHEHAGTWKLKERVLTRNLRASSGCFAVSERHRPAILDPSQCHRAFEPLRADIQALPDAGCVGQVNPLLKHLPEEGETAAILCRTNNEALIVHMRLLQQGIPHVLAVNADDIGLPAWVGRVFSLWTATDITRMQFDRLWTEQVGTRLSLQPEQAWGALQRALGESSRTRRFDMDDVRRGLAGRPELPGDSDTPPAPLTVSTIHRAKGREYDWVIILDGDPARTSRRHHKHAWKEAAELSEEARVLYVAATRPRQRLSSLRRGDLGRLRSLNWDKRGYVILPDRDVLVEVGLQNDVDDLSAAGSSVFAAADDVTATQHFLWRLAGVENPAVSLVREHAQEAHIIRAAGTELPLGRMSRDFSRDMDYVGYWLTDEIRTLTDVPARCVQTTILTGTRDDIHMPYRQSGMYLTLRLQGAVHAGEWSRG